MRVLAAAAIATGIGIAGLGALGCAGPAAQSAAGTKIERVQPCKGSPDGWCRAASVQKGFGAEFPGAVAESSSAPQPTPTGERVVVHVLAARDPAGTRFSLTCIEYIEGKPDPQKLIADLTKIGKPETTVKRGGFDGRLIRYATGSIQAIVGPRFICTQNVESTQGAARPDPMDVDRFFGSLTFGSLAY